MSEIPVSSDVKHALVDTSALPTSFPTHMHETEFWEWLGRAVATYGFLEEVLGKAIFAFSGARTYPEAELPQAMKAWQTLLERAVSETLNPLIGIYASAVKENPKRLFPTLMNW